MIKHIVFFKIKSQNKKEELKKLKEIIDDMGKTIPSVLRIEGGINISSRESAYDIALFAEFENEKALIEYQEHTEHIKLIHHLKKLDRELAVVDYKV